MKWNLHRKTASQARAEMLSTRVGEATRVRPSTSDQRDKYFSRTKTRKMGDDVVEGAWTTLLQPFNDSFFYGRHDGKPSVEVWRSRRYTA